MLMRMTAALCLGVLLTANPARSEPAAETAGHITGMGGIFFKAKGVEILKQNDDPTGRFAWIVDPEGNKIELWEPKRGAP